jgi:hypothetical protein
MNGYAHRDQHSSAAYSPYGRGHMKLSSNPLYTDSSFTTRLGFRQLRAVVRHLRGSVGWGSSSSVGHRHTPLTSAARPSAAAAAPATAYSEPGIGGVSPATARFVCLCGLWYMTSALSSNTGKVILMQFRYPVTLTIVQFGFVAAFSLLFMTPAVGLTTLRAPTRAIVRTTLPMGLFQVGGHMFSSMAISRIPVSTVHTIKVRVSVYLSVCLRRCHPDHSFLGGGLCCCLCCIRSLDS